MELDLLHVLENKDNYERYSQFVQRHTVTSEVWQIIQDLQLYYDANDTLDWDNFSTWFKVVKHPTYKEEKLAVYQAIFDRVAKHTTSSSSDELIEALLERDYATRIADISRRVAEGEGGSELADINQLLEGYTEESSKIAKLDEFFVEDDVASIFEHVRGGNGLNWRLPFLNYSCGPLRKGDFIIMSAFVDSGKTTMLASESTFMAPQLDEDQVILWFNNEEEGRKFKYRVMQAALGWDNAKMEKDMIATWDAYLKVLGGNSRIKIVDNKRMDTKFVENIIKKTNPGLIIFDQLWKVFGFEKLAVNEVDRQTKLFAWGRELAGMYAPTISVHQADGTASGQLWIEQNQLYGSRVGIQGEADAIITLGRSHESGYENIRGLYVPKNKLSGGPESVDGLRNGKQEVIIHPSTARFAMPSEDF